MSGTLTSRTGTFPEEGIKAPCVVATDANITLSGEQTINGANVVDGDRVLVKDQTDTTENGIYVASTSTWSRSTDFNESADVCSGQLVVDDTNDTVWKIDFTGDFTADTTAVTMSQVFLVEAPGADSIATVQLQAESVTLPKLARQASGYLLIGKGTGADMAAVAVSGDVTISNTGVVTIGAGKITQSMLASNIVDVSQLARQTSGYILVGKGTTANTAFVAVSGDVTISNTGVVTIGNSKITSNMIASGAVTVSKIPDAEITEAKLAAAVQTKLNTVGTTTNVLSSVQGGSSATNISVTGIDPTAVKIEIFLHLDPDSSMTLQLTLGYGGTPTYIASGYTGATGASSWSTYAHMGAWFSTDEIYTTITLDKVSSNVWFITMINAYDETACGYVDVTDVLSAIKLTASSGNFARDMIYVLEYLE